MATFLPALEAGGLHLQVVIVGELECGRVPFHHIKV